MTEKEQNTEEQLEIILEPTEEEKSKDDIVVQKVDSEPKAAKTAELTPEEGISELQAKLERERQARLEAERRAQEALNQANQAKLEVDSTNLTLVKKAIETAKRDNEIMKANYRDAMATGDYDQAAEIQAAMTENHAKLIQLENGRKAMEEKPKIAPIAPQSNDMIENLASQVTPESAIWLRQNKEFLKQPYVLDYAMTAHREALGRGIQADTPQYFQFIESKIGLNKSENDAGYDDEPVEQVKPAQKRSSPAAAPVTRGATGTGSRPNVVRLTAEEREIAALNKMTDQEYARMKLQIQRGSK